MNEIYCYHQTLPFCIHKRPNRVVFPLDFAICVLNHSINTEKDKFDKIFKDFAINTNKDPHVKWVKQWEWKSQRKCEAMWKRKRQKYGIKSIYVVVSFSLSSNVTHKANIRFIHCFKQVFCVHTCLRYCAHVCRLYCHHHHVFWWENTLCCLYIKWI